MKIYAQYAFSLLELLWVVVILSILGLIALPLENKFLARHQVTIYAHEILEILQLARESAIRYGSVVSLCPSVDGQTCGHNWRQGQILFLDKNGDVQLESHADVIRYWGQLPSNIQLSWHGFLSDNYLQFEPSGIGDRHNGHFVICVESNGLQLQQMIIVNRTGRARLSNEIDQAQPIQCE